MRNPECRHIAVSVDRVRLTVDAIAEFDPTLTKDDQGKVSPSKSSSRRPSMRRTTSNQSSSSPPIESSQVEAGRSATAESGIASSNPSFSSHPLWAELQLAMRPYSVFSKFYDQLGGCAHRFEIFDASDDALWAEPLQVRFVYVFPSAELASLADRLHPDQLQPVPQQQQRLVPFGVSSASTAAVATSSSPTVRGFVDFSVW
jgi:hypothetical protein